MGDFAVPFIVLVFLLPVFGGICYGLGKQS
jgi:hypothetical protein